MNPAYSVILFTTASGAGYGLVLWTCLFHVAGLMPESRFFGATVLFIGLALATVGLLSSTFHLGHPERAWRAVSQWRSSWLSREGVAALLTYVPAGPLWLLWVFGVQSWWTVPLALLAAAGAVVTVWCTGMIYASLRTIRQWHQRLVPVVYLALGGASGAVLFALISALFGGGAAGPSILALVLLAAALALKLAYFSRVDGGSPAYTIQMALGLSPTAKVRVLDPPHTRPNYVMREMGYAVARKHAVKLRRIALGLLFALPILLTLIAAFTGALAALFLALAMVSLAAGLFVERWLFFAEAEHVSMLYYGREQA